jgi:DNA-binding FrmR family transcriptional regulator
MTDISEKRQAVTRRLKRIEGQVQGLNHMLEEDRYRSDILHQVQATEAARSFD